MTVFNASDRRRYEQELLRAKNAAEQASAALQRSQATLAAERDRLRQILDILPVAVLIVGADGQTVLANAAARALLGRDVTAAFLIEATDAPGTALELLYPDGTPYPRADRPLRRSLQAGEAVPAAEALIRLASADRAVPVLVGSAALHDGDGVVTGAIAALQDITLLKELDRAREEFLGAAAHDLKTPLTSVQGLAQLARRRLTRLAVPQTQPVMEHLEGIEAAARRMVTLINDLIDVTRLQMGALLTLDRRPTDLVALARGVIGRQHDLDHRLMLETELENLVVTVDPDRIERVLDNLVGNALKYSPAGGTIVVRVARTEDEDTAGALLVVQDAGLGIPASDLPHIFERYYRAGNVRGRIAGTGIGLASVRQIVEQHGGTVAVESREGHGTTVTVRLPL
jgi:signal transduction histidine kinase